MINERLDGYVDGACLAEGSVQLESDGTKMEVGEDLTC